MSTPVQPWNDPSLRPSPSPSPSPNPSAGPDGLGGIIQLLMKLFGGGGAATPAPTPAPPPLDPILQAMELAKRNRAFAPFGAMANPETPVQPVQR